jgi:circadian clock protein KaiC
MPAYIKGFDRLVDGGLPKGSLTLVTGGPGTFKSIFCMQILYNNALKGEKCLFISLEQKLKDIKEQMELFGWGTGKLNGNLNIVSIDPTNLDALDQIWKETKKGKYTLIALDSLAALTSSPIPMDKVQSYSLQKIVDEVIPQMYESEDILRTKVAKIIDYIRLGGATALLISEIIKEPPPYSRDTVSEFLCDAVILMQDTGIGGDMTINLSVRKMRKSKINRNYYPINISDKGLIVEEESSTTLLK